jgi:hypothetical protein
MAKFAFPEKRVISPKVIRILSGPILILTFLIVLIIIVIQTGYSRIPTQLEKSKSGKAKERVLSENLSVLRQVQAGVLEQSSACLFALPEKNPSPFTLSLMKRFAEDKSILIEKVKTTNIHETQEGISSIRILITAKSDGGILPVRDFIQDFLEAVPISRVDVVELDDVSDEIGFELELSNYWSGLPEQLPAIDAPIRQLTEKESDLLERVATLERPEFTTLAPAQSTERETPFN